MNTPPADEDSVDLVNRCREGDQDAEAILFARYARRLVALAQSRLSKKFSRRLDPEDVVQSVFKSFFVRVGDGQFEFSESGDLWSLLARITTNKLNRKIEHHTAAKRQVDKEQAANKDDLGGAAYEAISREPSPEDVLILEEEIEGLTGDMNAQQRQIVELRLQGYLLEEIAEEVMRSERTVRRILDRVKNRLKERLDSAISPD